MMKERLELVMKARLKGYPSAKEVICRDKDFEWWMYLLERWFRRVHEVDVTVYPSVTMSIPSRRAYGYRVERGSDGVTFADIREGRHLYATYEGALVEAVKEAFDMI